MTSDEVPRTQARCLAEGPGWRVSDVVCCRGPHDRPFEEHHEFVTIALVTAGSFQYRASRATEGPELMTPGSLLLGDSGERYECGHDHAVGDRCLAFLYTPAYFCSITSGIRPAGGIEGFRHRRLPPLRAASALSAHASAVLAGSGHIGWEELSVRTAAETSRIDNGMTLPRIVPSPAAVARITRALRLIEGELGENLSLSRLAGIAGLSLYHFLRTFEAVTGTTPHRYIVRSRLRRAATHLLLEGRTILDIALDSGFGDVSNLNRSFRSEFGVAPNAFRRSAYRPSPSGSQP
jgi:AraC family transcriptional regulator